MKNIVSSQLFKPFIFLLVLFVMGFNISPMSAMASTSDPYKTLGEVDEETGIIILESLQFNEDKTAFVHFDEEYAKNKGLKEKDFVNIEVFFDLDYETFLLFKDAKLKIEKGNYYSTLADNDSGFKALLTLGAVISSMAFIGQEVAKEMISDLYELGAKKFCKSKWANKYDPISNSCEELGYR